MKLGPVFLFVALIWCVAVVIKAAGARTRGEPYRFTQWDGGLLLKGTELGPGGTVGFLLFAVVLGAFSAYVLAGGPV